MNKVFILLPFSIATVIFLIGLIRLARKSSKLASSSTKLQDKLKPLSELSGKTVKVNSPAPAQNLQDALSKRAKYVKQKQQAKADKRRNLVSRLNKLEIQESERKRVQRRS